MDSCTALSKRSLLALFYRSVPPYGMAGNAEAFTPMPKEKVCEMCKFRTLCPEIGRAHV